MMTKALICVRDVDEATYRRFKAISHERGMNLGTALTMALHQWTEIQQPKKRFLEFKPAKGWGKGTERTSTEVDKILYGKT